MAKRVLLFSSEPDLGGVATLTSQMKLALSSLGYETCVAYQRRTHDLQMALKYGQHEGTREVALSSFRPCFIGFHTFHWGKAWKELLSTFDAAIVACGSPYIASPFLDSQTPVYVWAAVTMREDLKGRLERFNPARKLAYRLALPFVDREERQVVERCDHFWALSRPCLDDFLAATPRGPKSTTILLPPIDTEKFQPSTETPDSPTVLFTGRYNDSRKDTQTLIKAFAEVRRRVPNARLRLIGEDTPSAEIVTAVGTYELTDAVELMPRVSLDALASSYQDSTVFALPSRQEGLCISGLEAMACGIPVVSTTCGGPESYIENGVNGYLVSVGDHDRMADRICQLLENEEQRAEFSSNARAFVLEHCDRDAFKSNVASIVG